MGPAPSTTLAATTSHHQVPPYSISKVIRTTRLHRGSKVSRQETRREAFSARSFSLSNIIQDLATTAIGGYHPSPYTAYIACTTSLVHLGMSPRPFSTAPPHNFRQGMSPSPFSIPPPGVSSSSLSEYSRVESTPGE